MIVEVLTSVVSVLGVIVGGGGFLFYKQNKKLKGAEAAIAEKAVLSKDLENKKSVNDEWIRLYDNTKKDYDDLKKELQTVREINYDLTNKLQKAIELEGHQRLVINDLTWSRCIVNECPNRQPPRKFEKKMKEIENMHIDVTNDDVFDVCEGCGANIIDAQED